MENVLPSAADAVPLDAVGPAWLHSEARVRNLVYPLLPQKKAETRDLSSNHHVLFSVAFPPETVHWLVVYMTVMWGLAKGGVIKGPRSII